MLQVLKKLESLDSTGVAAAEHAAFVLVAGGLGERLGYSGIKVKLPVDSARSASFLQVDLSVLEGSEWASQSSFVHCRFEMIHSTIISAGQCVRRNI